MTCIKNGKLDYFKTIVFKDHWWSSRIPFNEIFIHNLGFLKKNQLMKIIVNFVKDILKTYEFLKIYFQKHSETDLWPWTIFKQYFFTREFFPILVGFLGFVSRWIWIVKAIFFKNIRVIIVIFFLKNILTCNRLFL